MPDHPLHLSKLLVPGLFSVVGIGLLAYGVKDGAESYLLTTKGVKTSAMVMNVEERHSTSKGKRKTTYHASLRFHTEDGRPVTISAQEKLLKGQKIDVWYLRAHPEEGRINTTNALWGRALSFGGIGGIFTAIGLISLFFTYKRRRQVQWLIDHGQVVKATVIGINEHVSRSKRRHGTRRRYTYQVICQWVNPRNGQVLKMKSEKLSSHPGEHLIGTEIDVLIDPANPSVHFVHV